MAAEGLWGLEGMSRSPQRSALAGAGGAVRQRGAAADRGALRASGVAAVAPSGDGLEHDGSAAAGVALAARAAVDALGQGAANGRGSPDDGLSGSAEASWMPPNSATPAAAAAGGHARPQELASAAAPDPLELRDRAASATDPSGEPAGGPPVLLVANKADLLPQESPGLLREWPRLLGGRAPAAALRTSAATGAGLDALRGALLRAAGLAQVAPGALTEPWVYQPCVS